MLPVNCASVSICICVFSLVHLFPETCFNLSWKFIQLTCLCIHICLLARTDSQTVRKKLQLRPTSKSEPIRPK